MCVPQGARFRRGNWLRDYLTTAFLKDRLSIPRSVGDLKTAGLCKHMRVGVCKHATCCDQLTECRGFFFFLHYIGEASGDSIRNLSVGHIFKGRRGSWPAAAGLRQPGIISATAAAESKSTYVRFHSPYNFIQSGKEQSKTTKSGCWFRLRNILERVHC